MGYIDQLKYPEREYLQPYMMDTDVDIRCETVKIVKCRKEHDCHFCLLEGIKHTIKPGEVARRDTALVDGDFWGSYYACIPALNKWIEGGHGV